MASPHAPGLSFVRIRRGKGWWDLDDQLLAAIKNIGVKPVHVIDYEPPFGVGLTGRAALTLQKDRPGMLQRFAGKRDEGRAPLATLTMQSDASSGDVAFVIDPPEGPRVAFKPTYLMTQVSACLQAVSPVAVSKSHIESSVHGRADYKRQALDHLIDGGFAGVVEGGKYSKYQFIKPYVAPKEPETAGIGPLRRAGQ